MSYDLLKKHLLTAVVEGNEGLAKKIITSYPELLLDSSAVVTDLSGKKIKNLTPLQAAICAGDVDMVQMIKKVLQHKLQVGITLSFEPELEMRRQFVAAPSKIYYGKKIRAWKTYLRAVVAATDSITMRNRMTSCCNIAI